MQRSFIYGRKRREDEDVSGVRLPGAARQMDAERQRKTVIVIPRAIKNMPALHLCRHCICLFLYNPKVYDHTNGELFLLLLHQQNQLIAPV